MDILASLIGSLTKPAPTIRSIKKSVTFTQGGLVFLVGLVVVSVIMAAIALWTSNSLDTGTVFFNSFSSSFATGLFAFLATALLLHVFMGALEQRGKLQKLISTLAFPYVSISILSGIVGILLTGVQKLSGPGTYQIVGYLVLGFTFVMMAVSFYAYILYTLVTRENYGSSLAMAAIITTIAVLLTAYFSSLGSLSSVINALGGGLAGGIPY